MSGNASSALRPFASQGHLVGTVTGPPSGRPSQGSSLSILTEPHDGLAPSIVRGDEDRIMIRPSSRPEARSLLGCQTVNELGAPVASSIPAQLPGHEPASARMGYEDGHALFLRYRRLEGPLGRGGAA